MADEEEEGSTSEEDSMTDIRQDLETAGTVVQEEPLGSSHDNGAIQKTILKRGQGFETPKPGAEVVVNFSCIKPSSDGQENKAEAFRLTLDPSDFVCKGFNRAVSTMKKGEKAKFVFRDTEEDKDRAEYEIELVSWVAEENVTLDGEVKKIILKEGGGSETPSTLSLCYVSYFLKSSEGKCVIGTEDISKVDTVTLDLSSVEVMEGIVEVLKTMKTGERARVKIGSGYACKEGAGVGDLQGEVELLDFMETPKTMAMTLEEKLAHGNKLKELGNTHLKGDSVRRARSLYEEAALLFKTGAAAEHREKADQLVVQIKANLAMCLLKQADYPLTISVCSEALLLDPHNIKVLFRRAQAYEHLREHEEALRDLSHIAQQEGKTSSAVAKLVQKVKQAKVHENRAQARIFGGMFDKLSLVSDDELPPEARQAMQKPKGYTRPKMLIIFTVLVAVVAVALAWFNWRGASDGPLLNGSRTDVDPR
jgi:FKBP-type peptidyl-prolyl cis-trans isomerase